MVASFYFLTSTPTPPAPSLLYFSFLPLPFYTSILIPPIIDVQGTKTTLESTTLSTVPNKDNLLPNYLFCMRYFSGTTCIWCTMYDHWNVSVQIHLCSLQCPIHRELVPHYAHMFLFLLKIVETPPVLRPVGVGGVRVSLWVAEIYFY